MAESSTSRVTISETGLQNLVYFHRQIQESVERMRPVFKSIVEFHHRTQETLTPIFNSMRTFQEAVKPILENIRTHHGTFANIARIMRPDPLLDGRAITLSPPHRYPSVEEVAEIIVKKLEQRSQAKLQTETVNDLSTKANKMTGKLKFELSSGTITQSEIPKHKFQAKHPSEFGGRRFSKTGRVFTELFFRKAIVDKKEGREKNPGQPQRIDVLMGIAGVSTKESMRSIINSIQAIIDGNNLPLKILSGTSDGAEALLMTEEI